MAVGVQKYKVNNMAKDIDKKAKEIVELLKEKGYEGKSSSSVLETDEINVVLNHYLNQSKVDDIAEYLSAKKPEEKTQDTVQQEQTKAPAPSLISMSKLKLVPNMFFPSIPYSRA